MVDKINELKEKKAPIGCLNCLSKLDDGQHEYDEKSDIWYCPALNEE